MGCRCTHPFSDVTISGNNSNLASKHNVSGTLDAVNKGLPATIIVVKLRLCDGIIDVDSRNLQLAISECLVQMMDTGGGLFGDTSDICGEK